jgi:transcriptional regulator with XRE-family HTH domain
MANKKERRQQIASRLSLAREQAGLTQEQVAKLLDLHRPSISEIESGRRKVSADEIAKFAEIYGVGSDWLLAKEREQDFRHDRVELAARELDKLSDEDLNRVLNLLSSLRKEE